MISIWTVYDDPTDYPGKVVARRFEVDSKGVRATDSIIIVPNLQMMWQIMVMQLHLTRLPRNEGDDPKIVETWM